MAAHADLARVHVEYARLATQWAQSHWTERDRAGIWQAYEDYLLEECLMRLDDLATLATTTYTLEGGASRSERKPAYDLVELEAVKLIAERLGIGEASHGRFNYKSGGEVFVRETYNHLVEHVLRLGKFTDDDDLAAIGANFAILAWFRRYQPEAYATLFERGQK